MLHVEERVSLVLLCQNRLRKQYRNFLGRGLLICSLLSLSLLGSEPPQPKEEEKHGNIIFVLYDQGKVCRSRKYTTLLDLSKKKRNRCHQRIKRQYAPKSDDDPAGVGPLKGTVLLAEFTSLSKLGFFSLHRHCRVPLSSSCSSFFRF